MRESSFKGKPIRDARKLIFFLKKNKGLLAYTLKEQLYRALLAYDELSYRMFSLCADALWAAFLSLPSLLKF